MTFLSKIIIYLKLVSIKIITYLARPALELHDLFIGFLNFVFLCPGILVIHDVFEAGARGSTEKFDFHAFVLLRFAVAVSLQVLHRSTEPGTGKITSHFSQHRTRRSFLIQVFKILCSKLCGLFTYLQPPPLG